MENVIKISIGNWAFTLQQSAYDFLDTWFKKYGSSLDGSENKATLFAEAEEHIGAWLSNRVQSVNQVIDTALLRQAICECGLPLLGVDESADGNSASSFSSRNGTAKESGQNRRHLVRDKNNKRLGGVISGLAAYLETSTTLLRIVAAAVLCFSIVMSNRRHGDFFESVIWFEAIAYLILWICIPSEPIQNKSSNKVAEEPEAAEPVASALGRIVRLGLGCIFLIVGTCGLLFLPISMLCFPSILLSMLASLPFPGNLLLVKVLLVIAFVLPQLFFIYEGVKLMFGFHFKKLHLGLVLIALWLVNAFVLGCALAGNRLSVKVETNSSWEHMDLRGDTLYIKTVASGWDEAESYVFHTGKDDGLHFLWLEGKKSIYVLPTIHVDRTDPPAGYQMEYKALGSPFHPKWFDASDDVSFRNDTLTVCARKFDSENPWSLDRTEMDIDVPSGTVVMVIEPNGHQSVLRKRHYIPFGSDRYWDAPFFWMKYGK